MENLPNVAEEPGYRQRMEAKMADDPLKRFDPASAYAAGRKAFAAIFRAPLPTQSQVQISLADRAGVIRERLDRGERVVITANGKRLAVYEPTPGAVLAACLRRDYAAAGRVTDDMVDAARSFLPGVDPEALKLAIEGALQCERL
ncbi:MULTISPECIES: hypothetical protein [unclassified Methylobacterium]|uniref:hypothetical protein n=1 Tax=unclassified Methylobacterium TaxID=2615210 RepID=UPI0011C1FA80|nr:MULTISPECIES: hypothetical protein [unclassified Methylobacterium]QEE37911.1 hypothetical protein FVA80_02000 [Methylobacterium sp. WL1]TXN59383.1 hypothetical protein FV241_02410 [Methylobacterium sp. WL2]